MRVHDVKHRRVISLCGVVKAVHAIHLRAVPAQPAAVRETEIDGHRQVGLALFNSLAKLLPLHPRLGPARSSSPICPADALALVCCVWGRVRGGNRRERLADDVRELVIAVFVGMSASSSSPSWCPFLDTSPCTAPAFFFSEASPALAAG